MMIQCPKCAARVIPKMDGRCPSCQFQLADAQQPSAVQPAPMAPPVAAATSAPADSGAAAPNTTSDNAPPAIMATAIAANLPASPASITPQRAAQPFPASRAEHRRRFAQWATLGIAAILVAVASFVIFKELTHKSPTDLVAADYEPRIAALQQKLNAVLAKLPAAGSVAEVTPAEPPEPKPDSANTLFVSVDAVLGKGHPALPVSDTEPWEPEPETDPSRRFPDVRLSEDETDKIFRWRPDVANEYFRRPPERLKTLYEQLVTARYVVAVRFAKWVPPSGQGIDLTGGAAQVEAFLIDLDSSKILGSFSEEMVQPQGLTEIDVNVHETLTKEFGEYISEQVRARMGQLAGTKFAQRPRNPYDD